MKPVGLTYKDLKENPFTGKLSCELMIVHKCLGCGKVSKNRIAGDDYPQSIIALFQESMNISTQTLMLLKQRGIKLLSQNDRGLVYTALFGYK